MKYLVFASLILGSQIATAETYIIGGKDNQTKVQALMSLVKSPKTTVLRCNEVELSERATIRNKKKRK